MTRWIVILFGACMVVLALVVAFNNNLTLPTRTYPRLFHFLGLSRYLLSASLLVFGGVALAIAAGKLAASSRLAGLAIGAGIVLLGVAFISAPRY